ncbi:MAG: radical SAM protein [Verrucomicrobia bacterium]|nr:radical SAM protein [Verrucomicrobiota bacterium]MBV8276086.1 radical SAM protein [Verrucomicrobiota bacterium]
MTKTNLELDASGKSFATGLLPELITTLRRCGPGDLLAVVSKEAGLGADLELWCRFTRNTLIETTVESGRSRWVIRCGEAPADGSADRPIGSRLWLYTNFDCNLHCDYCCVRSSPKAPRRELGLPRVRRVASEAAVLGVSEFFVTGGEPFLLPDIGDILAACTAVAPTTVLTNGAPLVGRRLEALRSLPPERLTLQISLDSPTPEVHDRHRGKGTWERALKAIELAHAEGFRVRLAATVSNDEQAEEFKRFLDARHIDEKDRVIRRIALRGFAIKGVALARADLVPEVTITADGVYWHPVGADDPDLLVTPSIFPLAEAFAAVRRAFERETEHGRRLASIFNCA